MNDIRAALEACESALRLLALVHVHDQRTVAGCRACADLAAVDVTRAVETLEALASAQSAGEWVTVPRVPTEAMTERGNQALSPWIAPAMHADDAYRAMLAAAPIAPAVASEPGQPCPHITECAACPKIAAWAGREMDAKDAAEAMKVALAYINEPAGIGAETIVDKERFAAFLDGIEARKKEAVRLLRAAIAAQGTAEGSGADK